MTIIRNIFFSNTKVTSGYRYRNDFALVPISGIETLQDFAQWYPCVIEVRCEGPKIDKSVHDSELLRSRALSEIYSKKITEVLALLSTFTIYLFKMSGGELTWFNDDYTTNRLGTSSFMLPDFENYSIDFSEISSLTELSEDPDYPSFIPISGQFLLPANLGELFDIFYTAEFGLVEGYIRAARLHQQSRLLYSDFPSLSFAAFISCIETLAQLKFPESSKCQECGQDRLKATKKFKDFLLTYGKGDYLDNKFANKIYGWRSKILHEGQLFIWDLERKRSVPGSNINAIDDQWTILLMVYGYVRVALVNFLLKEDELKKEVESNISK